MARLGYLYKGDKAGALRGARPPARDRPRHASSSSATVIQEAIDDGLFPYTKRYLGTLRNHFSTIGVNGINEMIRNFTGDVDDITTRRGRADRARRPRPRARPHGRVPGGDGPPLQPRGDASGGHHVPLRQGGRTRFPGILQAGTAEQPVLHELHPAARGLHRRPVRGASSARADLQSKYTGGTVLHLYMGERVSSVGRVQDAREAGARDRAAPVHHGHADVLDLPEPRLPRRRAAHVPAVRGRGP